MKNLNISLKDLTRIKFDSRYLFLSILLIVLVLDGLVVKDSVGIVLQLENQTIPSVPPSNAVRINFKDYDYVDARIQNGRNFIANDGVPRDPFNPSTHPVSQPGAVTQASSTTASSSPH